MRLREREYALLHYRQQWLVYKGITAGFLAHTALKYLLEFEDISYYLQYNARNEFFQSNIFRPNVECMDKQCLENQKYVKENGISYIKARENLIKAKKAEKNKVRIGVVDEKMKKWNIDIIEDSEARQEFEVINAKERDEMSMEQLIAQMKQL